MSTTNQNTQSKPANPPVAKVRVGLVTASIWERSTGNGKFFGVTFERRYRDSQGEWQTSHSYDPADLLALAKSADLAHTKIMELQSSQDD